jgi:hypothetical protein
MQGDKHGLADRAIQLLATHRGREHLTLRSRAGISHPENYLWRRPSRRFHLGVLHLLPATFAEAQVGLAKVAITALDATRLKVAGCLAA